MDTFIHVPTPGDHYSPATGSAVMTVIYELSRQHAAAGGETVILVGHGTRHDYPIGACHEAAFGRGLPSRRQKLVDAAMGRLGLERPFLRGVYRAGFEYLRKNQSATVFLHNAPGVVRAARRLAPGARLYLYCHNELFRTFGRRELERVVGDSDGVICVSNFLAEQIQTRLRRRSAKVHVVHNGVDTEKFHPAPPRPASEVPLVLFLGRVIRAKGPDLLLRAAADVFAGYRHFRVRIRGSSEFSATGPLSDYERELRQMAKPLGDRVQFEPFIDRSKVVAEYQGADIAVIPSNCNEGMSLGLLEAMSVGLPTIAARRGGIPEAAGDGALYFDPPDVSELADHLKRLVTDADHRAKWASRARARAEHLSWIRQYKVLRGGLSATGHPANGSIFG